MEDFVKIYTGYLKDIYRFLLKLSGNPDIAEELTQATFAAAFEHLEQFQGKCKISVWLCQIAKHEYYAYYRRQKCFVDEEVSEKNYEQLGTLRSMEEDVIRKEEQMRILKILRGIPEPYQEVFTLRVMGFWQQSRSLRGNSSGGIHASGDGRSILPGYQSVIWQIRILGKSYLLSGKEYDYRTCGR